MKKIWLLTLFMTLTGSWMASVEAQEENVESERLQYMDIKPGFVTNYARGSRLKYMRADVSVRVSSSIAFEIIHHMPYIKNSLVLLFSEQAEEDITSSMGREVLRQAALDEIRRVMNYLEGISSSAVDDLYFTNFVVQQ